MAATREAIRKGYAYLASTNFKDNDLSYTRPYAADLQGAELRGAQLVGTNLRCANLLGADMTNAKINKFEAGKTEVSTMTDTRLANVDKAGQLSHTITIPQGQWHDWEQHGFTISRLQELLGSSVSLSDYPEHFCLGETPLDRTVVR